MHDRICMTIEGGVADVRLNRPGKMNAIDPEMFKAIAEAGQRLQEDRSIRAVVLSGEGRAFCAGLDVERLMAASRGEPILPFADLPNAPTASRISRSTWCGCGASCRCPSSPPFTALRLAAAFSSCSAPICAT